MSTTQLLQITLLFGKQTKQRLNNDIFCYLELFHSVISFSFFFFLFSFFFFFEIIFISLVTYT